MKSMRKTFLKTNISIWNNTEFTDKNIIKNISMYLKAFKFLIYLIYNKVVIYVVWIVWRIFRGWESMNLLKSLNLFKSQKILKIFINHQILNERKKNFTLHVLVHEEPSPMQISIDLRTSSMYSFVVGILSIDK